VLEFDQRATLSPQSVYDKNPTKRGVGTVTMRAPNGFSIDLIAQGAFRSGEIAALVSLRDDVLVDAQAQLDEFAAGLSQALSDRTIAGVPAGAAPQTGFDINVSQMRPGDVITLNVVQGGTPRTVSIVRVDDASALPLPASATPNPNDQVIGVPFSGGSAAAAAFLQTALGAAFAVSSPVAGTLRVLDDGAAGTTDVTAATARVTEGSASGGTAALPFFVDAGGTQPIYSGSFDGGSQKIGYSMRMAVNDALQNDPSLTVLMSPTTLAGDATRPNAMLERINKTSRTFAGVDGIGSADAPPSATVISYLKRLVSAQGQQAETERRMAEGQEIVVNGLQDRFDAGARVNIDEEMARLIELQQTYQASARIISIVDEMMRTLLQS
jgi:flagellar hook-associated protein 1 FlgK